MSLIYRLDAGQDTINVAYSVGKKVGKAVVRNKVKRRMRALVQECSCQMDRGDYLFLVSPRVADVAFADLRDEVRALLPLKGKT